MREDYEVRRGEYRIIRVDGTEQLVEEKPTLDRVYQIIGCDCVDTVILAISAAAIRLKS